MSLVIKLNRIVTNFKVIDSHLEDCHSKGQLEDPPMSRWQSFVPLANLPAAVNFTTEELTMLLQIKANALFNVICRLDAAHNALIDPLRTAEG
jgi:hypothetical protein